MEESMNIVNMVFAIVASIGTIIIGFRFVRVRGKTVDPISKSSILSDFLFVRTRNEHDEDVEQRTHELRTADEKFKNPKSFVTRELETPTTDRSSSFFDELDGEIDDGPPGGVV